MIAPWVDTGTRNLAGRGLCQADARAAMYALLTPLEDGFLLARVQHTIEPLSLAGRAIAAMPVARGPEALRPDGIARMP